MIFLRISTFSSWILDNRDRFHWHFLFKTELTRLLIPDALTYKKFPYLRVKGIYFLTCFKSKFVWLTISYCNFVLFFTKSDSLMVWQINQMLHIFFCIAVSLFPVDDVMTSITTPIPMSLSALITSWFSCNFLTHYWRVRFKTLSATSQITLSSSKVWCLDGCYSLWRNSGAKKVVVGVFRNIPDMACSRNILWTLINIDIWKTNVEPNCFSFRIISIYLYF